VLTLSDLYDVALLCELFIKLTVLHNRVFIRSNQKLNRINNTYLDTILDGPLGKTSLDARVPCVMSSEMTLTVTRHIAVFDDDMVKHNMLPNGSILRDV